MAHRFIVVWLLIMAVFFSTAQVTTELPPPPPDMTMSTTATPLMTTTPGGCVTDKGDQLAVGESKQETDDFSCTFYTCESPGEVSILIVDCFFRMSCVDPVRLPGACCRNCPNGENCRVPSGKVIPAGQDVVDGDVSCRCPLPEASQDPTKAECEAYTVPHPPPTPTTILPPPTTTPLSPTQKPTCEASWTESKGACYKCFNHRKTFADAEAVCADSMSSKLATAKTRQERNFVRDFAMTTIWIGGNKRNRTDYVWSDGTAVNCGYSAWKTGEPDGKLGYLPDVNCMIMNRRGEWQDFTCTTRKKPFVCKYILQ